MIKREKEMNKQTGIGEKRSREKIIIITAIIAVLIVVAIVVEKK